MGDSKRCSKCMKVKALTEFSHASHAKSRDGYRNECKQCGTEKRAAGIRRPRGVHAR